MLYDPARHEALQAGEWSADRARETIERIVRETEAWLRANGFGAETASYLMGDTPIELMACGREPSEARLRIHTAADSKSESSVALAQSSTQYSGSEAAPTRLKDKQSEEAIRDAARSAFWMAGVKRADVRRADEARVVGWS